MFREESYPSGFQAGERDVLDAFLRFHQDALLRKVQGLSDSQLVRAGVPSGLSLIGLVKHGAYVHNLWFHLIFAGQPGTMPYWPENHFVLERDETPDSIVALYRVEVVRARRIVGGASLDDVSRRGTFHDPPRGPFTLRFLMLHMIQELARHNGHADVLREQIDGVTGE